MADVAPGGPKLKNTKVGTAGGFAVVRAQVEEIVREGYSASQILTQVSVWNPQSQGSDIAYNSFMTF